MYRVIAKNREEIFYNLNQVYGFLVGLFENYRLHHPNVRFFKRWYQARCKRGVGQENYVLIDDQYFQIKKITPSPQQAPRRET